jgi:hypothetical protein
MVMADRASAIIFCALGMAILVGGYTMDRLEIRQIHRCPSRDWYR